MAHECKILVVEVLEEYYFHIRNILNSIKHMKPVTEWAQTFIQAKNRIRGTAYDVVVIGRGIDPVLSERFIEDLKETNHGVPRIIISEDENTTLRLKRISEDFSDLVEYAELTPELLGRSIRYSIDINELHQELDTIQTELASSKNNDSLTGLINRRELERLFLIEMERFRRGATAPICLLLGIDHLKSVNAKYGHSSGDIVLIETGKIIQGLLRHVDCVARIQGDEFFILLGEVRFAEAMVVAERIRNSISARPIILTESEEAITASVSIMQIDGHMTCVDDVYRELKKSLTKAKENPDNSVLVSGSQSEAGSGASLKPLIDGLVNGTAVETLFQVIMDPLNNRPVGFEALSRGPNGPYRSPIDFFKLALDHNVINRVDMACAIKAIEVANDIPGSYSIHMNLFPSTLVSIGPEGVGNIFKNSMTRHSWCVEISEQQVIGDPSYIVPIVQELKRAGIGISLDDIGFGKSCLESLIFLDPDVIKIDKACVMGLHKDKTKYRNFERLVKICKSLDTKIVAEGVEFVEDLQILKALKVDYVQGYYFGKPSLIKDLLPTI